MAARIRADLYPRRWALLFGAVTRARYAAQSPIGRRFKPLSRGKPLAGRVSPHCRCFPRVRVPPLFFARAGYELEPYDVNALATFSSLISRDSWTDDEPSDAVSATGSISWGHGCAADGNYTFALGYECSTANTANYGLLAGRSLTAGASADFFGSFGYQNTIERPYFLVAGRGHIADEIGQTSVGLFSEYTSAQADPVIFQVGNGTSTSQRSNSFTLRKSGLAEMKGLPVHADQIAAQAAQLAEGTLYRTPGGELHVAI